MKIYTKQSLINRLMEIRDRGWVKSTRPGNDAAVGNTLEDLLEITENNLPLPNAGEWEIKAQREGTSSLITLFHMEPSPRALHFVPRVLLPKYGWPHRKAGGGYRAEEMSFRQTITGNARTDRGFAVLVNWQEKKVVVSFDAGAVAPRHRDWLESVDRRTGLGELDPQPYWGFDDLTSKARAKLVNCFYLRAEVKREGPVEYFHYTEILMLSDFASDKFIREIENRNVLVDFDARSGHNHGTKFRLKHEAHPLLYSKVVEI